MKFTDQDQPFRRCRFIVHTADLSATLGLQTLVHALIGRIWQHPVVLVASTLLIAARFQPSRPRLQVIVNHRFTRRKPDTANILEIYRSK